MSLFKELLCPLNLFQVKRTVVNLNHDCYIHDLFEINKVEGQWIWQAIPLYAEQFNINSLQMFSTWQQARDQAIEYLQPYFNLKINPTVKQFHCNIYQLVNEIYPHVNTHCFITKYNNGLSVKSWQFKSDLMIPILDEEFITRQQCVEYLYNYVATNLDKLYTPEITSYTWTKQRIDSGEAVNLFKPTWWMLFIKPEIDLSQIL